MPIFRSAEDGRWRYPVPPDGSFLKARKAAHAKQNAPTILDPTASRSGQQTQSPQKSFDVLVREKPAKMRMKNDNLSAFEGSTESRYRGFAANTPAEAVVCPKFWLALTAAVLAVTSTTKVASVLSIVRLQAIRTEWSAGPPTAVANGRETVIKSELLLTSISGKSVELPGSNTRKSIL